MEISFLKKIIKKSIMNKIFKGVKSKTRVQKCFIFIMFLCCFANNLKAQDSPCSTCAKAIFIVDNSGSVDDQEYSDMQTSINLISQYLLNKAPSMKIAIVQYGTDGNVPDVTTSHLYNVSVPFTNNITALSGYTRVFDSQDHLPGSLGTMRLDNVWGLGGQLDLASQTCIVKCFIFTDAWKEVSCCSYLINSADAPNALPNYDEYNYLKNTYGVEFSVYHVVDDATSVVSGAAISSVGGDYNGSIDANPGDPQGSGTLPRKYIPGTSFVLSQVQIESIVVELTANVCDSSSSFSVPNVFSPNGDGTNDFFTVTKKNIKKMDGVIYNRWGLKMTDWTDIDYKWDGKTSKGLDASDGTYYYIINAEGADGKKYEEKGFLTLIR